MEINNKDILILGGWGLVGTAICRELIEYKPKTIIISSLTRQQAESACNDLSSVAGQITLQPEWGNIFVRSEFKDLSRDEILNDPQHRLTLAGDVLERTTSTEFARFYLYDLIKRTAPDIIIDCVNSATGLAYQDIYSSGLKILQDLKDQREGRIIEDSAAEVEKLLCSLYLPQLVRHVQVLYQGMKDSGTKSYIKVGTSGTGGMGLNIPYTHSEDKPSRVLLSKSSVAGAHSLLLFLMGRTPDAPYTKEIKPATAIAWKSIGYGEILRHGEPIALWDCPFNQADELKGRLEASPHREFESMNRNLEGVYIDTGENGTFSIGEFTALTTHEQMEFITPEEIAQTVIWEIEGGPTGHDIVSALDAAILGPTYRAGVMRSLAISKMRKLAEDKGEPTVAFELLGPPRLSKLLYEAHLLKRLVGTINAVLGTSAEKLSTEIAKLIEFDKELRSRIISIGIPILLPDGKRLLRGPVVKVPHDPRKTEFEATAENIDNWCHNGWIDLRKENMIRWQERFEALKSNSDKVDDSDTSSFNLRNADFWKYDKPFDEGEIVGWIFIEEDEGRRMK